MNGGVRTRARRLPILQRSIRYHRPRAPFCGVGYCTNCLVRTDRRLNIRACREGFPEGVRPTSNAWPSPRYDLWGAFDYLFPRGIDTLHGFRRPTPAVPLYQRVVRRLAGYDSPERVVLPTTPPRPPRIREADVLIIGNGASGAAAADELRARGIDSLIVLDRDGGPADEPVWGRTTAVFLPPPSFGSPHPFRVLASEGSERASLVFARRVVVATGGYDASLLFPGNDRPGVMTADGAFSFAKAGFEPFRHAVVFGGGSRALQVVESFDSHISAVVAPGEIGPDLARVAADRRIPLYPRSLVLDAKGRSGVRSIRIRGRSFGPRQTLAADALVLAHRRIPHPQLFFQAGVRMVWRPRLGAYAPAVDGHGATTVPGLFAVGSAAGAPDADASRTSGRAAARAIAEGAEPGGDVTPDVLSEPFHEMQAYYRELLAEPQGLGKWIACPCEDVLLRELREANEAGYRGIEEIKRYTGLGTGLCQGRYCLPDALLVLSIWEGRPPPEVGYITQRPPVVPTPLGLLATLEPALPRSEPT